MKKEKAGLFYTDTHKKIALGIMAALLYFLAFGLIYLHYLTKGF